MATLKVTSILPPRTVLQRFRPVLTLPDDKLRALNAWVKQNIQVFFDDEAIQDPREIEANLGISLSDFPAALSLIGALLFNEQTPGSVDLENFANHLKEIGLGDLAPKAIILLDGIKIPPDQAVYIPQRSLAVKSVVPTLEDADALCDLRAIFRRLPSASQSSTHQESVKRFLGFEPMVLVGLELNDNSGNDNSCTFQVTEKGLRSLIKTLNEALAQLEIIKAMQPSIPKGGL